MRTHTAIASPTATTWPQAKTTPALDQRSFRDTLGRYPTGVVLICAMSEVGPVGMAVNSFTSVSLDPPLISFCPMLTSATWAALRDIKSFAVSILGAEHADVSRLFATKGADRFAHHDWAQSPLGHPVLSSALCWIDATITSVTPAGDHELVIAEATTWSQNPEKTDPLVFFSGKYHNLANS